jgi:hypothetical protein
MNAEVARDLTFGATPAGWTDTERSAPVAPESDVDAIA